jgi:hypothetical protein
VDYNVTVDGIDYVVRIASNHFLQSTARVIPLGGGREARSIIWHKGSTSPKPRVASKAPRAARVIEREEITAAIKAELKAEVDKELADALKEQADDEYRRIARGERPARWI